MNSYEQYIWKLLKNKEEELSKLLKEPIFAPELGKDKFIPITEASKTLPLWPRFYSLNSQIDILYMILTGHDNKYGEEKKK
mgnify:CR=1 FL=1